jgi:hypothetical protein
MYTRGKFSNELCIGGATGLVGYRHNHGEQVLRAVIYLAHEKLDMTVTILLLRDVKIGADDPLGSSVKIGARYFHRANVPNFAIAFSSDAKFAGTRSTSGNCVL